MKLTAKRSDMIISVSGNLKKEIVNFLKVPENHVVVVQHGVSDMFSPVQRVDLLNDCKKKYGIKDEYILFVGNNVPGKNLENLVSAFNHLKRKYNIPHQLVLVGSIDLLKGRKELLLAAIQQATEIEIDKDIVFTGFVEHTELPSLYSGASVFVFPSYCESFGMPLLEAMACGTPVVTSNISAMPEVVGDAGILVNPYDVEEIAEAVYRVLSKPSLREKLVEKGLERVKHFSWEKAAKNTLAVFEYVNAHN
jgi:glycosyltransferase involved in cell wall biosynthesis